MASDPIIIRHSLYALHESLVILKEEGLNQSWARHALNHQAFVAGIEKLGLSFIVDEAYRLPQLNAVTIQGGIDEAAVRNQLLSNYNLEIGAGLGSLTGKVWRIGLMGFASNRKNVLYCLSSLANVLAGMGANVDSQGAISAALDTYTQS